MSWSFQSKPTLVRDAEAALAEVGLVCRAQVDSWPESQADEKKASIEQLDAALEALKSLVGSGVAGGFDKTVVLVASGHGNPYHEPKQGMSNDEVRVGVIQQS